MIPATAEGPTACCPVNLARWPDAGDPCVDRLRVGPDVVLLAHAIHEGEHRVMVRAYQREAGGLRALPVTTYATRKSGETLGDVVHRAEAEAIVWVGLTRTPNVVRCAVGARLSANEKKARK